MIEQLVQFRDLYLQAFNASEPNSGWPARPAYSDLARDGAYRIHGAERSPRGTKRDKRRWMLVAPNPVALDYAYADLLNEIGNAGRLTGLSASGLALWTDAELLDARAVGPIRPVRGRMRAVGIDVDIDLMLNTPGWFEESQQLLVLTDIYDTGGGDMLLMDVMGATPGTPVDMTWDIRGRANASNIVITLTSGTGAGDGVTKLALTNTTTGYSLVWIGTLPSSDVLTIDVDAASIYRDGVAAYGELTLGAHTRWFELAAGINAVTVEIDDTATDDSTSLQIAYYPTYP